MKNQISGDLFANLIATAVLGTVIKTMAVLLDVVLSTMVTITQQHKAMNVEDVQSHVPHVIVQITA